MDRLTSLMPVKQGEQHVDRRELSCFDRHTCNDIGIINIVGVSHQLYSGPIGSRGYQGNNTMDPTCTT